MLTAVLYGVKPVPAKSKKQEKFMQAVANNPAFAKKVGVPQSVGKEFTMKKPKKMAVGGNTGKTGQANVSSTNVNKPANVASNNATKMQSRYDTMKSKFGDKVASMTARAATMPADRKAAMTARAGDMKKRFDARLNTMKARIPTPAAKKDGGSVKKYAAGGLAAGHKAADGIAKKGKTKGKEVAMKKGGYMKGGKC